MKTILALLILSCGLAAQPSHYEDGTLVRQVNGPYRYFGGIGHRERQLQRQDAAGHLQRIPSPADLGQHRGYVEAIGHWQGTSYALAVLSHPLFTRIWDRWNPKDHTNRRDYLPRVLYRSRNGRTWERIATHHRDPYCQFGNFLPLGDGRFLVDRAIRLFEKDGAASPIAIYGIDGQGRLVLDALVPVEPATRDWIVARTDQGIALINWSCGKWCLLSNDHGRILREGMVWPGAVGGLRTARRILYAAPRPDGGILLAVEEGPVDRPPHPAQRLQVVKNRHALGPAERLVAQHLQQELRNGLIAPVPLHWWHLDPSTGAAHALDPPKNFPALDSLLSRASFRFVVLPSGDLSVETGLPGPEVPGRWMLTWNPLPLADLQRLLAPSPRSARR